MSEPVKDRDAKIEVLANMLQTRGVRVRGNRIEMDVRCKETVQISPLLLSTCAFLVGDTEGNKYSNRGAPKGAEAVKYVFGDAAAFTGEPFDDPGFINYFTIGRNDTPEDLRFREQWLSVMEDVVARLMKKGVTADIELAQSPSPGELARSGFSFMHPSTWKLGGGRGGR